MGEQRHYITVMLRLHYKNLVLVRNLGLVSLQYILTYYRNFTQAFNNHDISRHTCGGITAHQCAAARRLGNADL